MNQPREARRYAFVKFKGECQECGFFSPLMGDFDVDHIKPLFEAFGDPSYYEPENLQLLCKECHKTKSGEDLKRYWELRNIETSS